jgi:hypothetical protein
MRMSSKGLWSPGLTGGCWWWWLLSWLIQSMLIPQCRAETPRLASSRVESAICKASIKHYKAYCSISDDRWGRYKWLLCRPGW